MRWTAIVFGIAILAGVAILGNAFLGQRTPPTAAEAKFSVLEETLLSACKCKREGGDEKSCDEEYLAAKEYVLDEVYGQDRSSYYGAAMTACGGISSEGECFDFADGTRCITIYNSPAALCTEDEADAYLAVLRDEGFEASEELLRSLAAGQQIASVEFATGCS